MFATRIKQANLASKNDFANFVKKTDFNGKLKNINKKLTSNKAWHTEDNKKLDDLAKEFKHLSKKVYNFFLGRIFFTCDDGSQGMFVFQPTFYTIKHVNNVSFRKSKWIYHSESKSLHELALVITSLGHKMELRFSNGVLAVMQNNCKTTIANVYIVYELDTWPRYVLNNFSIKKCLFGATNIVKNSDKYKYVYTGYGIAFD